MKVEFIKEGVVNGTGFSPGDITEVDEANCTRLKKFGQVKDVKPPKKVAPKKATKSEK